MIGPFILVFVGGALGAMLREFIMLMTPHLSDRFPLDILIANLVAAFLLGLITAQHNRQAVSDDVNLLVGTGIMGGLSTFSSFAYGAVSLVMSSTAHAAVATAFVIFNLVLGYIAVKLGLKLGGAHSVA